MPQAALGKVGGWSRGFFLAPTATSQVYKDESLGWGNLGLLFIGLAVYSIIILVHGLEPTLANRTRGDLSPDPLGQFSIWETKVIT